MFSKTVGNVTFHFEPLIIFGVLIAIILLLQIIRSTILELKFRQVTKNIMIGKYDDTIQIGEKLLHTYQKYNARLSTKPIVAKIEYLNFALSVSYFATSNDDQFLLHINALIKSPDIKEFWLSLFYLQKNDFATAKMYYDKIVCNEDTYVNRTFLEAFQAYRKQESEFAKKKMAEVIDLLKHPILKQIANKVLY